MCDDETGLTATCTFHLMSSPSRYGDVCPKYCSTVDTLIRAGDHTIVALVMRRACCVMPVMLDTVRQQPRVCLVLWTQLWCCLQVIFVID